MIHKNLKTIIVFIKIIGCNQGTEGQPQVTNNQPIAPNVVKCKDNQEKVGNNCIKKASFCEVQGDIRLEGDGICRRDKDSCDKIGKDFDHVNGICIARKSISSEYNNKSDDITEDVSIDIKEDDNALEVINEKYEMKPSWPLRATSNDTNSIKLLGKIENSLNRNCFLTKAEFEGHASSGWARTWVRRIDALENKNASCRIHPKDPDLALSAGSAGSGDAYCEAMCTTWELPSQKTIISSSIISVNKDNHEENLNISDEDDLVTLCGLLGFSTEGVNNQNNPGLCQAEVGLGKLNLTSQAGAKCKAKCMSLSNYSGVSITKIYQSISKDQEEVEAKLVQNQKSKCILTSIELNKAFYNWEKTGCRIFKKFDLWILGSVNASCSAQCIIVD